MRNFTLHLKEYFPKLGDGGCDAYVDCYLPYNMKEMHRENDKRPCMVICPGGGYGMCSERESEVIGNKFLSAGYNVFIVYYSVAPHRFPQQLCEVAATVNLIHKNNEEWNCDTEKIAIMGFSAGGHLAAHYSNAYNTDAVTAVIPEAYPVNASVLCYPVISACEDYHKGSFVNLLGYFPEGEEAEKFSCEKLVSENTPPAFLWHTAEDNCVPVENTLLYANALSKYKIPFEVHIYPFGWHGLATADKLTNNALDATVSRASEWISKAIDWLEIIFNK